MLLIILRWAEKSNPDGYAPRYSKPICPMTEPTILAASKGFKPLETSYDPSHVFQTCALNQTQPTSYAGGRGGNLTLGSQ